MAGASGLIGSALTKRLAELGYEVVALSRSRKAVNGTARVVEWDGATLAPWTNQLEGALAVVNLSGYPISCRWTAKNREKILRSRVDSTRAIGQAVETCSDPPSCWINGSATGYYGDRGSRELSEASLQGTGFLADVCGQWEDAQTAFQLQKTRLTRIRAGVVFCRDGGALPMLIRLTKWLLGGAAGAGRQFVSWIDLDDLVDLYVWAIEEEDVFGPVNGTAPQAVANSELMAELRRVCRRPWSPPAPAWLLRALLPLIGKDPSLVLEGARVYPQIAASRDFPFQYPQLRAALERHLARSRAEPQQ